MSVKEKATDFHKSGFNCAQSVLCACGEYTGLDDRTALAVSAGFGGGVRCGEMCGAITGAVMALGLAVPFNNAADTESKVRIAALTKDCVKAFREKYGCIRCLELKQAGVSCADLIEFGAELAENMIKEIK